MTRRAKSVGGMSLAALAGLLMMAATPILAQSQSPSPQDQSYPQNQPMSGPSDQNAPGMTSSPSDQSNQATGNMQGTTTTRKRVVFAEPLTRMRSARTMISSAEVRDSSGQPIGQVTRVISTRSGHPSRVDISLTPANGGPSKVISIRANRLMWDRGSRAVVTKMTTTELQNLPAATSSSL